jgi:hypothetical protein
MNDWSQSPLPFAKIMAIFVVCFCMTGCGHDPEGIYEGEITDWVKWVFVGTLVDGGKEVSVELTLRQGVEEGGGGPAELLLGDQTLNGKWLMDGAKRRLLFDEKVYFLTKDGTWYNLYAKDFKLENDDGQRLRLLLNKGRSTERGIRVSFTFRSDGTILFNNNAGLRHEGEWQNQRNEIVASLQDTEKSEIHKFYFSWDQEELLLKKLVILMGVGEKVGKEFGAPSRKSRSSSKVYDDPPRFRLR